MEVFDININMSEAFKLPFTKVKCPWKSKDNSMSFIKKMYWHDKYFDI